MTRRYYLETLGCKLNRADTERLARELAGRGMQPAARPEDADLMVVNTCTVTGRADADGRQALRRLARSAPGAHLVAMGCYARRDPAALTALPGVSLVAQGADPAPVVEEARRAFPGELSRQIDPYHASPVGGGRTRALLKVQDGCNLTCSYCIIPSVRGRSRSLPVAELEDSLTRLVAAGFAEVVLTGVNTGDYGHDLPDGPDLLGLLRRLTRVSGLGRLRLNSLEPRTISKELVRFLADTEKVAPHLQVPLQSGSDRILQRMRRNYRSTMYREVLDSLAHSIPDIGLGADVIVGFPGESEADFAATETLVQESPLTYLHVFSYSQRPGTDAAGLDEVVPPVVTKARVAQLRSLAAAKGAAFRQRYVGRVLTAVTLEETGNGGDLRALTGNFFEVALPAGTVPGNRLVEVRVLSADASGARGVAA
jgi:threonylcarbamoyladenosine tRNA methylthiotransferase MtaB